MASPPPRALHATQDTTTPSAPSAQAAHRMLRAAPATKPQPERFKSQSLLHYEDRCDICMDLLFRNTPPFQQKIKAAFELGDVLRRIDDDGRIHNSVYLLRETMLDDSENYVLRMACAVSLGSSGYKGLVREMEKALKYEEPAKPRLAQPRVLVMKSPAMGNGCETTGLLGMASRRDDAEEIARQMEIALESQKSARQRPGESIQTKLLILKCLAICRSDEAIELLGTEAKYGKVDEVCFAAAKELAGIGYPARKIVRDIISDPPEAYVRHPEFLMELKKLMMLVGEYYISTN